MLIEAHTETGPTSAAWEADNCTDPAHPAPPPHTDQEAPGNDDRNQSEPPHVAADEPLAGTDTPPAPASVPMATAGQPCPTCGHRARLMASRADSGCESRLGQGQLHGLALDHMRAHPEREWMATGIAKAIDRSSGPLSMLCWPWSTGRGRDGLCGPALIPGHGSGDERCRRIDEPCRDGVEPDGPPVAQRHSGTNLRGIAQSAGRSEATSSTDSMLRFAVRAIEQRLGVVAR